MMSGRRRVRRWSPPCAPAARAAPALLACAGCLVACAGWPASAPAPVSSPATPPAPVRVSGLFAVSSQTMGTIVIDGRGYVLYRSDHDSRSPSRSACTDACTLQWLPVPAAAGLQVVGINRQLVGQYTRPDGQAQLTLDGWPLYEFAGDRSPGDVNGQGVDHAWWVIRPDGGRGGPADPAA